MSARWSHPDLGTTQRTRRPSLIVAAVTLAAAVSLAGCTAQPSPHPSPKPSAPTLGSKTYATDYGAPGAMGFGKSRPTMVFLGGDPTGVLSGIKWQTWGGKTATGTASAVDDSAGATVADAPSKRADVVAFDLGTCHGVPMYKRLLWYFPSDGGTFENSVSQWQGGLRISGCETEPSP